MKVLQMPDREKQSAHERLLEQFHRLEKWTGKWAFKLRHPGEMYARERAQATSVAFKVVFVISSLSAVHFGHKVIARNQALAEAQKQTVEKAAKIETGHSLGSYFAASAQMLRFEFARSAYYSVKQDHDYFAELRKVGVHDPGFLGMAKENEAKFARTRATFKKTAGETRVLLEPFCATEAREPACSLESRPLPDVAVQANLAMVVAADEMFKNEDAKEAKKRLSKRPKTVNDQKAEGAHPH